jgi:hypothetical protein
MRLLVLRAKLAKETRARDELLSTHPDDGRAGGFDDLIERWGELDRMTDEISTPRPYPNGDSSSVVNDEPLFGRNNSPAPDELLYHYTRRRISGPSSPRCRSGFKRCPR